MKTFLIPVDGLSLIAVLLLESLALAILGQIMASFAKSHQSRRTIWRATLLGIGLCTVFEATGILRELNTRLTSLSAPAVPPPTPTSPSLDPMTMPISSAALEINLPTQNRTILSTLNPWISMLWIAGTLFLLLRMSHLQAYLIRLKRGSRKMNPLDTPELQQALQRTTQPIGKTRFFTSPNLLSPIAFGLFQPAIGLPDDFQTTYTPEEQSVILLHELTHLQERDPAWQFVSNLLQALLWWNPALMWVRKEMNQSSEFIADEASLHLNQGPTHLAQSLIKLGHLLLNSPRPQVQGMNHLGYRSSLAKRVQRLLHLDTNPRPLPTPQSRWIFPITLTFIGFLQMALTYALPSSPLYRSPLNRAIQYFETPPPQPGDTAPATPPVEPPPSTQLFTRSFKIPTSFQVETLRDLLPNPIPLNADENELFRLFLNSIPLDYPLSETIVPQLQPNQGFSKIVWNNKEKILFVRASMDDLDKIQDAIARLTPPQFTLTSHFIDIPADSTANNGFILLLGSAPPSNTVPVKPDTGTFPSAPRPVTPPSDTNTRVQGFLTREQAAQILKAAKETKGINLLASPRITSLVGRQAVVSVMSQPNDNDWPPQGVSLDVIPRLQPNGEDLDLTLRVLVKFQENGKIQEREFSTRILMTEEQTAVFGGLTYEKDGQKHILHVLLQIGLSP